MATRPIIHRFKVQPDLNVVVEDSLNILIELTSTDGLGTVIARSNAVTNVDTLTNALASARAIIAARIQGDS